jgi:hypothetical protein
MNHKFIKLSLIFIIISITFNSFSSKSYAQNIQVDTCHFGINNVYKFIDDYDMTILGADSYINWDIKNDPIEPENYQHVKVIRVWGNDDEFEITKSNLPDQLDIYPGSIWIIGNEPDTTYEDQDNLTAETYALRFVELSSIIRNHDPSALIGFAPIVQPSPVRIYYLELVIAEMEKLLDGTEFSISDTFDIWTIHAFLLNEMPNEWGTGLPQGITMEMLDENHQPLDLDYRTDTHSITLFKQLIINFRQWIFHVGLGDKPLWIAEYGSLMPYYYVPENETIEFMIETFDFLLSYKDTTYGFLPDNYRLVQKWYWFSLNHSIYDKGGSLYNLDINSETNTGLSFRQYEPNSEFVDQKNPDFEPISIEEISPLRYSEIEGNVDYLIKIRVRNHVSSDHISNYVLHLYDENDNKISSNIGYTVRCGGDGFTNLIFSNITPGSIKSNFKFVVKSNSSEDINPSNDELLIEEPIEFLGLPRLIYLPLIHK